MPFNSNEASLNNTDSLAEGSSNLYFTDERVDDRVNALLSAGTNVTLTYDDNANTLTIDATGAGGETNTASNVGTSGVGIFKQKDGVDLEFKKLVANSTKLALVDDTGNDVITIDITENNIVHQNLSGAGTNTHAQIDTHIADTTIHFADLSGFDTDDLSEGVTNKYYTDERVDDRVNALLAEGANITLTYDDVSNTLTIASSGGSGSLYFDDDGGTPSTSPSASGTRSIAIGDGASAATADSLAIGTYASVSTNVRGLALGSGNKTSSGVSQTVASGINAIAIGNTSATGTGDTEVKATGEGSICIGSIKNTSSSSMSAAATGEASICIGSHTTDGSIGNGPQATASRSIAIGSTIDGGSSTQASNTGAIAIGSQASATGSTSIAIGYACSATGSQAITIRGTAGGSNSIAVGNGTNAVLSQSITIGYNSTTGGENGIALGNGNSSPYSNSISIGRENTTNNSYSAAIGYKAKPSVYGQFSFASGMFSTAGDAQFTLSVVRQQTTDAATTVTLSPSGSTERLDIPADTVWLFEAKTVGIVTGGTGTPVAGDVYAIIQTGCIKRVGGTTSLVGTVTDVSTYNDASMSGCTVTPTADDAADDLDIDVTGVVDTNINWCSTITMTQVK